MDISTWFYDFYYLQSLSALPFQNFNHAHDKLKKDIYLEKIYLEEHFARALYDGMVKMCAGELRHSYKRAKVYIENISESELYTTRESAMLRAEKFTATSILLVTHNIFTTKTWNTSFGGNKWGKIAEVAMTYGKSPDSIFIDTCADLKHNGGIAFDKKSSGIHINDCLLFKNFLNYKASITDLIPSPNLGFWPSRQVLDLFYRASMLFNDLKHLNLEGVKTEEREALPPIVNWGTELLTFSGIIDGRSRRKVEKTKWKEINK